MKEDLRRHVRISLKQFFCLAKEKKDEAVREAETALKEANGETNKQILVSCYSVLGKVYRSQKRYEDSLKAYQYALDYWNTQTKPNEPNYVVAMILNNMGEEYKSMGELDKALSTLLEAKSKTDENATNYWAIVENLGTVYFQQNKFTEAENSWKEAIKTAKDYDHRSETDSMCNLVVLYFKQGRNTEAQNMREQAIKQITLNFRPSDSRIAALEKLKPAEQLEQSTSSSAADAAWKLQTKTGLETMQSGKFAEAEKPFQAALKEAEHFGVQDPRFSISLSNLGVMYVKLGKFQQAELYLQRALPIARKIFNPQSPQIIAILDSPVPTYIKLGKFEQAEPILKEFILIQEKSPSYSKEDAAATHGIYKNLQAAIEQRKQHR